MGSISKNTTLSVDRETAAKIEALKQEFSASSKSEILRKAISLLDYAREARKNGGRMSVTDSKGATQHILIP